MKKYSSRNIHYSEHSSVYYLRNHKLKHATQMSDHASHESIKSGANGKKNPISCRGCFCHRAAETINKTSGDYGEAAASSRLLEVTMANASFFFLQLLCIFFFLLSRCLSFISWANDQLLNGALVNLGRSPSAETKVRDLLISARWDVWLTTVASPAARLHLMQSRN